MLVGLAVLSVFWVAQALLAMFLAVALQFLYRYAYAVKPSYGKAYLASFLSMALPLLLLALPLLPTAFAESLPGAIVRLSFQLLLGAAIMYLVLRTPQGGWRHSWPLLFVNAVHSGVGLFVLSFIQVRA